MSPFWLAMIVLCAATAVGLAWAFMTGQWPFTPPGEPASPPTRRPDLHDRALPRLTEMAADNPRLAGLLAEIERGRQRQEGP